MFSCLMLQNRIWNRRWPTHHWLQRWFSFYLLDINYIFILFITAVFGAGVEQNLFNLACYNKEPVPSSSSGFISNYPPHLFITTLHRNFFFFVSSCLCLCPSQFFKTSSVCRRKRKAIPDNHLLSEPDLFIECFIVINFIPASYVSSVPEFLSSRAVKNTENCLKTL